MWQDLDKILFRVALKSKECILIVMKNTILQLRLKNIQITYENFVPEKEMCQ